MPVFTDIQSIQMRLTQCPSLTTRSAAFAQDALNVDKRVMAFVLDALDPQGSAVIRSRLAMRRTLPPNVSHMGDITSAGGWTGLTGQELWILSSIFPFLLSPIFDDPRSLVSPDYCFPSCFARSVQEVHRRSLSFVSNLIMCDKRLHGRVLESSSSPKLPPPFLQ